MLLKLIELGVITVSRGPSAGSKQASVAYLDLNRAPYVSYGVKCIGLESLVSLPFLRFFTCDCFNNYFCFLPFESKTFAEYNLIRSFVRSFFVSLAPAT